MLNSSEPSRVYASIFQLASAKLTLAACEAAIRCSLAPAKCKVEHAHCITRKLKVVPDRNRSIAFLSARSGYSNNRLEDVLDQFDLLVSPTVTAKFPLAGGCTWLLPI
jgi:hypothetical protein